MLKEQLVENSEKKNKKKSSKNILLNNNCRCRKNENEDILCTKIKYYVNSYPEFWFILYHFNLKRIYMH